MTDQFNGKTILVTGGTGSIGSEIVRQLLRKEVKEVRVFSRDESKQFDLAHSLENDLRLRFLIGDIRDKERLDMAMEGVDVVFHAAALKHVVACERNPFEAIKTNIQGTQNVIDCAFKNGVDKVVGVSTDKAASPTNVMGCTKLLAERLMLASYFYKGNKKTRFCCVRFGNVLASRGSVIPLFLKQMKEGSPVTITDPEMSRFFMSIPQAVDLIFKASDIMRDHEIFILKMPVATIGGIVDSLIDLVQERNNLSKRPEVKIIGKRVGEKKHEKLLTSDEAESALENDDMFIIRPYVGMKEGDDLKEESYPNAVPAKLKEYSSEEQINMTRGEVKAMLASICNLDFTVPGQEAEVSARSVFFRNSVV